MNFKTHHVAGLVATEATLLHFNQEALSLVTPIALIGGYYIAILSDVDKPTSVAGKKLWAISQSLRLMQIRHRSVAHSLLWTVILWAILISLPIPEVLAWSLVLAFSSHWFIDMFNASGVELFWPVRIRVKFLPSFLAVPSDDSIGQDIFRMVLRVCHYLLLAALIHPYILSLPWIGDMLEPIWYNLVSIIPEMIQPWFK